MLSKNGRFRPSIIIYLLADYKNLFRKKKFRIDGRYSRNYACTLDFLILCNMRWEDFLQRWKWWRNSMLNQPRYLTLGHNCCLRSIIPCSVLTAIRPSRASIYVSIGEVIEKSLLVTDRLTTTSRWSDGKKVRKLNLNGVYTDDSLRREKKSKFIDMRLRWKQVFKTMHQPIRLFVVHHSPIKVKFGLAEKKEVVKNLLFLWSGTLPQ